MFYYANYWGMDIIWWFIWVMMMIWIFALPYDIPGQRKKRDTALDILQKRYAAGEIGLEEYQEIKKTIEDDLSGKKKA